MNGDPLGRGLSYVLYTSHLIPMATGAGCVCVCVCTLMCDISDMSYLSGSLGQ